jgi:serine protease
MVPAAPTESRSRSVVVRLDRRMATAPAAGLPDAGADLRDVASALKLSDLRAVFSRYPALTSHAALRGRSLGNLLNLEARRVRVKADLARSLSSYFIVDAGGVDEERLDTLVAELRGADGVSIAYREPLVEMPAGKKQPRPADPLIRKQGYLKAAPKGIGVLAKHLWQLYDGAGVGFVDVEQGWNLRHEDLERPGGPASAGSIIHGVNLYSPASAILFDHGTAVLGIVLGQRNDRGGFGIAPGATFKGASSVVLRKADKAKPELQDVFGATMAALSVMAPGDVLLLELQDREGLPVERWPHFRDAIRFAVASGIVVVAAAGNNATDLDRLRRRPDTCTLRRGDRHFVDTGAILVSACEGKPPRGHARAHRRWEEANYGSRVDCFAWGDDLWSAGNFGEADVAKEPNRAYAPFDGTSSASAIIAGAAIVVQQMAHRLRGSPLSPAQLRLLLADRKAGTPVLGRSGKSRIGVMPDLARIVKDIPGLPDLYVRDALDDNGVLGSARSFQSPDIIVAAAKSPAPESEFGDLRKAPPSVPLQPGRDHFIYLRVSNRQQSVVRNVSLRLFWSDATRPSNPSALTELGQVKRLRVGWEHGITVAGPIRWSPTAAQLGSATQGSFVAVLEHPLDPAPPLLALFQPGDAAPSATTQLAAFAAGNNNVAWRTPPPAPGR